MYDLEKITLRICAGLAMKGSLLACNLSGQGNGQQGCAGKEAPTTPPLVCCLPVLQKAGS